MRKCFKADISKNTKNKAKTRGILGPITIFSPVEEEAGDFVFGQVILLLLQQSLKELGTRWKNSSK